MLINGSICIEVDAVDMEQAALGEVSVALSSPAFIALKAAQQNPDFISLKRILLIADHGAFFDMAVPKRGGGAKVHFHIRPKTQKELDDE